MEPRREPQMREDSTKRIYDFQSHFYDAVAKRIVCRRQSDAIARMGIRPGDRVLDIGVGTGLSLSVYPRDCQVVGVDLSEGMLRRAAERARQAQMHHVTLMRGDALHLFFAPNTFDHILISHVISVVSDPVRLLDSVQRVAKPDARIVIINHFQSSNRLVAALERWICPLTVKLGWRSDLSLNDLIERTGLAVDFRYKLRHFDLFETVFATNRVAIA